MFQLIHDNACFLHGRTMKLSTVHLPPIAGQAAFESCFFASGISEVVDTYSSAAEAAAGHIRLARVYGLSHQVR